MSTRTQSRSLKHSQTHTHTHNSPSLLDVALILILFQLQNVAWQIFKEVSLSKELKVFFCLVVTITVHV